MTARLCCLSRRSILGLLFALVAIDADGQLLQVPASAVVAGGYHTCALTGAGGVACWGNNSFGQLGDGTTTSQSTPAAVSGLASGVAAVAAGRYHTCALTTGGAVLCWGHNTDGQLGDGTTVERTTPTAVSGLASGVAAIAAGGDHTCAVTTGGAVMCWGANVYGQLGDATTTERTSPTAVSGLASGVASVTTGFSHSCALTVGGGVVCWGDNSYGAVGDGTTTDRLTPTGVSGLSTGVASTTAGGYHSCAVTGGGLLCWGHNASGEIGDGTTNDRSTPTAVSGLASGVAGATAGLYHTCALTTGGGVLCWGRNSDGQIGDNTTTNRTTATAVTGLSRGLSAAAAGFYHTCVLTTDGGVACWGYNYDGELGDATTIGRTTPAAVSTLEPSCIFSIAPPSVSPSFDAGWQEVILTSAPAGCAAGNWEASGDGAWVTVAPDSGSASGSVAVSWPENPSPEPRSSSATIAGQPFRVNQAGAPPVCTSFSITPSSVTAIRLAGSQLVTLAGSPPGCAGGNWAAGGDGAWVTVWPTGGSGPGTAMVSWDGNEAVTSRASSAAIADLTFAVTQGGSGDPAVAGIFAGGRHSCMLTIGGGVACWGNNSLGQGGDGTLADRYTPTAVSGLGSGATELASGDWHTCALTAGGAVRCFGYNAFGQLGDGTTTLRATPTDVTGLSSGVAGIAAGSSHMCALTAGGGVVCWGDNSFGQLGDGTTTGRLTPTGAVGLSSGVTAIAAGGYHTCALMTGGGMRCWGDNYYGELGDGTTSQRLTPTAVSGLSSGVAATALGYTHTCALTTGGAVLCWGDNLSGDVGDGTTTGRSAPTAVNSLSSGIAALTSGLYHTCAQTAGGGAVCWGANFAGQLGDATTTDRWSPVAVSGMGAGVAKISAGSYHTCALTTGSEIYCWGYNYDGQVGDGTTANRLAPKGVSGFYTPAPAPTVTQIAPASGLMAGHTAVTITGTNFVAGATVTFGGSAASNVSVASPTQITVTTPAHAMGTVDVVVATLDGQQETVADGYQYLAMVPVDLGGNRKSSYAVFRDSAGEWWIDGPSGPVTLGQAGDIPVVADYNGDGKAELAVYRPSTSEWIVKDQAPVVFGQAGDVPVPGYYNGDGKAEMAAYRPSTGEWLIEGQAGMTQWGMRGDIPVPADYDGDGVTELAVFRPTTGVWYVMNGATLEWGMWGDVPVPADYNGDGKAEIAVYRPSTGWWYVAQGPTAWWGAPGDLPVPLDLDGDGVTEFVVYRPTDGLWYGLNPVTSATSVMALGGPGDVPVGQPPQLPVTPIPKTAGDFDDDGAADITVFRPSDGGWYTLESKHAYRTSVGVTLGQTGDVPVPGDYQGAGRQERAVYRPSTGQWLLEDGRTFTLGAPGDIPVPGDYDGDAVMDLAVFSPSLARWSILTGSSGFATLLTRFWGQPGDVPAPGDYDGDGKTDLAAFSPSTGEWTIQSSLTGTTLVTLPWGMMGDIPVPADYDGDGRADIAVYRPSTGYWYSLRSGSGWSFVWARWGAEGDIPVPGDYDGDGRADVAVYRPSTGAWYVMNVLTISAWGEATDVPILGRK